MGRAGAGPAGGAITFMSAINTLNDLIEEYQEVGRTKLEELQAQGAQKLLVSLNSYIQQSNYERFSVLMGTIQEAVDEY